MSLKSSPVGLISATLFTVPEAITERKKAISSRASVTIVGAGNVGATAALMVASSGIDVRLVDVVDGLARGKAIDIGQSLAIRGISSKIEGGTGLGLLDGASIVVVTAGLARKPGMSRSDLLRTNAAIVKSLAGEIKSRAPQAIVIVVTNPLDVMTYLMLRETGFDENRVMGMGGVLDSGRMKYFLSQSTGVSPRDITAAVIGSHGDHMIPRTDEVLLGSVPAADVLSPGETEAIAERTKKGGAEIVSHLKTGSAYFAPAAAIALMVQAVAFDEKRVLPACVPTNGRYGTADVCLGVPVVLGAAGVEDVPLLSLDATTQARMVECAKAVRSDIDQLDQ